jgi:hypothetical protein
MEAEAAAQRGNIVFAICRFDERTLNSSYLCIFVSSNASHCGYIVSGATNDPMLPSNTFDGDRGLASSDAPKSTLRVALQPVAFDAAYRTSAVTRRNRLGVLPRGKTHRRRDVALAPDYDL